MLWNKISELMQKKSCIFVQFSHCPMRSKRKRQHSHAPTPATRGELHFNELLILGSAPVIITDLMNMYAPCLKLMHMRNGQWFRAETAHFWQTRVPFSFSNTDTVIKTEQTWCTVGKHFDSFLQRVFSKLSVLVFLGVCTSRGASRHYKW